MRSLVSTLIIGLGLAAGTARADCSVGPVPKVPDGKTATKEQLMATQQAIKAHDAAVDAFQACLAKEEADAGAADTPDAKKARVTRYNDAVAADAQAAADFNQQVKAFKARSP